VSSNHSTAKKKKEKKNGGFPCFSILFQISEIYNVNLAIVLALEIFIITLYGDQ
jgi:hypothetical protein